jgi:hypothetical protein
MPFTPSLAQRAQSTGLAYISGDISDSAGRAFVYRLAGRRIERRIVDLQGRVASIESFPATPADIARVHEQHTLQRAAGLL